MNDPHVGNPDPDDLFEVTPEFLAFSRLAFEVWENNADPATTADEIRELAFAALRGDLDDEISHSDGPALLQAAGKQPHTQGIADSRLESLRKDVTRRKKRRQLESDARALQGFPNIIPRKMSRAELQAAADKIVGITPQEREVMESRRLANPQMSDSDFARDEAIFLAAGPRPNCWTGDVKLTPAQLREDASRILSQR